MALDKGRRLSQGKGQRPAQDKGQRPSQGKGQRPAQDEGRRVDPVLVSHLCSRRKILFRTREKMVCH